MARWRADTAEQGQSVRACPRPARRLGRSGAPGRAVVRLRVHPRQGVGLHPRQAVPVGASRRRRAGRRADRAGHAQQGGRRFLRVRRCSRRRWLIAGAALARLLPARLAASISTGLPLGTGASRIVADRPDVLSGVGALSHLLRRAGARALFDRGPQGPGHAWPPTSATTRASRASARLPTAPSPTSRASRPARPAGPARADAVRSRVRPRTSPAPSQYPPQYPRPDPDAFPAGQYGATPEQYPPHDPFGLTQERVPRVTGAVPARAESVPGGPGSRAATQTGLQPPYGQPDPGS